MQRIGFIGMGLMGRPMSQALLRAGFPVTVWNRTRGKAGIDPGKVMEITSVGGARTGAMEVRGPWMIERNFAPHFSVNNMYKDLSTAMKLADVCGAVLPTASLSLEMLRAARSRGNGKKDSCVIITVLEALSGL